MVGKNRKLVFHQQFLNMNNWLTIPYKPFKFSTLVLKIQMQSRVSQIVYFGPSFYFMNSRNLHCKKKYKKLPDF